MKRHWDYIAWHCAWTDWCSGETDMKGAEPWVLYISPFFCALSAHLATPPDQAALLSPRVPIEDSVNPVVVLLVKRLIHQWYTNTELEWHGFKNTKSRPTPTLAIKSSDSLSGQSSPRNGNAAPVSKNVNTFEPSTCRLWDPVSESSTPRKPCCVGV